MKNTNINLIVLTIEFPIGIAGTKRIIHLLQKSFNEGISVKILSLRSTNRIENEIGSVYGLEYERIGSELKLSIRYFHRFIAYNIKVLFTLFRIKKKGFKNVIYSYGGVNVENFFFLLFTKLIGFKIIFDIVEDYTFFTDNLKLVSRFKFWTAAKLDRLNFMLASHIVVVSTFLAQKYSAFKSGITILPITAVVDDPLFLMKNSFNDVINIVYAGSFGNKDGVDNIIEAFLLYNNENSKLYLVGSGELQSKYKAKYFGFKNIIFTGFVEDKEYYEIIKYADILCMCRTNDRFSNAGFPFKLGEYLATGNPVIATKVSDVELYLTDEDAFLINSNSPIDIKNAIDRIVSNPKSAFEIGRNGRDKCKLFFDVSMNSEKLHNLLLKL